MRVLPLVLFILLLSPAVQAEQTSALINEELDKVAPLQVDGALPQVIKQIEKQTGVSIQAAPSVYQLLPWGEDTNVSARIENQTLRQALTAISLKLGLTFELRSEVLELTPMPALARLGRRSTVQELEALDLLSTTPMGLATEQPTVKQLVDAVDQKLEALKSNYAVEFRPGTLVKPDQTLDVPRNVTMSEALEGLVKETDATWYPWGKSIVIVPKEEQIRDQLNKVIGDVHFNGVDVQQALADLEQRASVPFTIEPGAFQRVAPQFRNIRILADSATIRQVLEYISAATGLGYVVNAHGVYIWNQSPTPAGGAAAANPAIGMLTLDNGIQVILRDQDFPPDLKEFLEYKKQRAFTDLRQMMKDANFHPATQPATQPAATTASHDL